MKINKYLPFAFIYFFLNIVGLPFGLLYTMLLTPLFYYWISTNGKKQILLKFFLFFLPFIVNQLINGVDLFHYVRSLVIFFTVYIFCYAFHTLITTYKGMEGIFNKILTVNFLLTLIALLFVFTPYRSIFWGQWSLTSGETRISDWPRLKMFTFEPSYYATLFAPIFSFYFIKLILKQVSKNQLLLTLMIVLPLILALSMGSIASLILAMSILFLLNIGKILTSKKLLYSFIALSLSAFLIVIVLLIFYKDNPFFARIIVIFAGKDGSANGRTYQAFYLAYTIADLKSLWWGIGPGQLKIIGDSVIKAFYKYPPNYGQVSIPSAFAETIALFGIVGATIKLFIEIYLFFKTKVLSNYYRTLLFFYIFIYQFTGSFTTNIAEYVIWILAFTNVFPQFDKQIKTEGKLTT